jgi:hypothetical protein
MAESGLPIPITKPRRNGSSQDIAREVANIFALDSPVLRQKWAELFSEEPPPLLGRSMMIRAIAYCLQERAFGGLKPSTLRALDRAVEAHRTPAATSAATRRASPGTVLIREWRGVAHRVTVLDNDVLYRGRRYKSLSEVARAITGSRWSGPLFFGLKRRAKEVADG